MLIQTSATGTQVRYICILLTIEQEGELLKVGDIFCANYKGFVIFFLYTHNKNIIICSKYTIYFFSFVRQAFTLLLV